MDAFLKDVNVLLFKEWILNQNNPHYSMCLDEKNDNHIIITTEHCLCEVTFHINNIIELSITQIYTNEIVFYLHFQMTSMKHAIDLFNEMIDTLLNITKKTNKKILICCTSGLTSSFFVSKIKEAIKLLSYDYHIEACSYSKLQTLANSFDIILLAPQISYLNNETKNLCPNKLVLNIPSYIFAKYDVGELLTFINNEYKNYNIISGRTDLEVFNNKSILKNKSPLFCISVFEHNDKLCICKTLYKNKEKLINDISIKSQFTLSDLTNMIDSILVDHNDIQKIHISLPCYIKDNVIITTTLKDFYNFNLLEHLKNRYVKLNFYIDNYIQSKLIGYQHVNQNKSVIYLQKNNNNIECATMINGILIKGDTHFAGNLNYLPVKTSQNYYSNNFSFQDQSLIKTIVSLICIISPETIILNEDFPYSLVNIKEELAHYLPQDFLPNIEKSSNDLEYLHIGQIILSNKKI